MSGSNVPDPETKLEVRQKSDERLSAISFPCVFLGGFTWNYTRSQQTEDDLSIGAEKKTIVQSQRATVAHDHSTKTTNSFRSTSL